MPPMCVSWEAFFVFLSPDSLRTRGSLHRKHATNITFWLYFNDKVNIFAGR